MVFFTKEAYCSRFFTTRIKLYCSRIRYKKGANTIVVFFCNFLRAWKLFQIAAKLLKKCFARRPKYGDFDTKIVLGSGLFGLSSPNKIKHKKAKSTVEQGHCDFLGGEFSSFCWRFGGGFGLQDLSLEVDIFYRLKYSSIFFRRLKAGIKKAKTKTFFGRGIHWSSFGNSFFDLSGQFFSTKPVQHRIQL